jgi:hypothetical protein
MRRDDENTALKLAEETAILEDPRVNNFQKKILPEWMPDIMAWAGDGLSLQKIADKIEELHHVKVTPSGVRYAIKRAKQDRSAISKAVVQANIGQFIVNDLEILKRKKEELVQLSDQFKLATDWKNYFQTIDRIKEYSKMLMELSGVHEQERNDEADNAKQDLLEMFEKFGYGKIE